MYESRCGRRFVVRWPGVIKPGGEQKAMALNADFAPTLLEAAGVKVPDDMQGHSLVPLLRASGRLTGGPAYTTGTTTTRSPQHTGPLWRQDRKRTS